MKEGIHPEYPTAKVVCACGAAYDTRSTRGNFSVEVCAACHPFYTGKQKMLDTKGRVDRFRKKYATKDAPAKLTPGDEGAEAGADGRTCLSSFCSCSRVGRPYPETRARADCSFTGLPANLRPPPADPEELLR